MAPSFALIRLVVLSTVVVFSLIALGMAAAVTSTTQKFLDVDFSFADLGIATAVLTMITVLPMIALEILRPGGPTSMIIAEIPWLAFLSILWLSTGAEATEFNAGFWFACGRRGEFTLDNFLGGDNICSKVSALQAFGFLNWIILMGYVGMLLVMSFVAASRKHTNVWTSSVANAPFSEPAPSSNVSAGSQTAPSNTAGSVQAGTVQV